MKLTVPHVLAYLAGILPVLQQLLPSVIPPPYGVIAAGVIGILGAAGHQLYTLINTPPSSTAKLHWLTVAGAAVLLVLSLAGCASISSFLSSPTGNAVVTAAVDVAVATAESKGVSAAQINGVAKQALAADSGVTATASAISGVLSTQLAKLNLPAGDAAAIDVLETAFSAALIAKIGSNTSVASAQADIATLLNQVIADTGG